jgi:hypothetical protein
LRIIGRFGQQQPRALSVGRRHRDPALAAAKIDVFDEQKAQLADVPGDRLVLICDDKRDGGHAAMFGESSHLLRIEKRPTMRRSVMS